VQHCQIIAAEIFLAPGRVKSPLTKLLESPSHQRAPRLLYRWLALKEQADRDIALPASMSPSGELSMSISAIGSSTTTPTSSQSTTASSSQSGSSQSTSASGSSGSTGNSGSAGGSSGAKTIVSEVSVTLDGITTTTITYSDGSTVVETTASASSSSTSSGQGYTAQGTITQGTSSQSTSSAAA
jgi:hypothetical protein